MIPLLERIGNFRKNSWLWRFSTNENSSSEFVSKHMKSFIIAVVFFGTGYCYRGYSDYKREVSQSPIRVQSEISKQMAAEEYRGTKGPTPRIGYVKKK